MIAILIPIVISAIVFVIVLTTVIIPKQKLKHKQNLALSLLDSGDYDAAYALFEELGDYDAIVSNKYDRALALIDSGDYDTAYFLLDGLNYKDSADQIENCYIGKYGEEKYNLIKNLKVGDTYKFGAYEQDNNTYNGKEEIEWIVIDRDGMSLLLLSKYALDCQPYNRSFACVEWTSCSLNKWLNGTFMNDAFSSEEQKSIIYPTVTTNDGTTPDYKSTDRLFLLNMQEVNSYLGSNEVRCCVPTDYAIAQGAYTFSSDFTGGRVTCKWWVSSSGKTPAYAAFVTCTGNVNTYGLEVDCQDFGVRPALWINLGF